MAKYLTHASVITCSHHGRLVWSTPVAPKFKINGDAIVVETDLSNATITGCTQTGPGLKPCTKIVSLLRGPVRKFQVHGNRPVLDTMEALTDGSPPGQCTVQSNPGSVVGPHTSSPRFDAEESTSKDWELTRLRWSKSEARQGDTVTLSASASNLPTGAIVAVDIYEYDADSEHDKVGEVSGVVEDEKIRIDWNYEYHRDEDEVNTDAEGRRLDEKYRYPEYYFVMHTLGRSFGDSDEPGLLRFKSWIEISLRVANGEPGRRRSYKVTLPDGSVAEGNLDEEGKARLDNVPPGLCLVEFPTEIDRESDSLRCHVHEANTGQRRNFDEPCLLLRKTDDAAVASLLHARLRGMAQSMGEGHSETYRMLAGAVDHTLGMLMHPLLPRELRSPPEVPEPPWDKDAKVDRGFLHVLIWDRPAKKIVERRSVDLSKSELVIGDHDGNAVVQCPGWEVDQTDWETWYLFAPWELDDAQDSVLGEGALERVGIPQKSLDRPFPYTVPVLDIVRVVEELLAVRDRGIHDLANFQRKEGLIELLAVVEAAEKEFGKNVRNYLGMGSEDLPDVPGSAIEAMGEFLGEVWDGTTSALGFGHSPSWGYYSGLIEEYHSLGRTMALAVLTCDSLLASSMYTAAVGLFACSENPELKRVQLLLVGQIADLGPETYDEAIRRGIQKQWIIESSSWEGEQAPIARLVLQKHMFAALDADEAEGEIQTVLRKALQVSSSPELKSGGTIWDHVVGVVEQAEHLSKLGTVLDGASPRTREFLNQLKEGIGYRRLLKELHPKATVDGIIGGVGSVANVVDLVSKERVQDRARAAKDAVDDVVTFASWLHEVKAAKGGKLMGRSLLRAGRLMGGFTAAFSLFDAVAKRDAAKTALGMVSVIIWATSMSNPVSALAALASVGIDVIREQMALMAKGPAVRDWARDLPTGRLENEKTEDLRTFAARGRLLLMSGEMVVRLQQPDPDEWGTGPRKVVLHWEFRPGIPLGGELLGQLSKVEVIAGEVETGSTFVGLGQAPRPVVRWKRLEDISGEEMEPSEDQTSLMLRTEHEIAKWARTIKYTGRMRIGAERRKAQASWHNIPNIEIPLEGYAERM